MQFHFSAELSGGEIGDDLKDFARVVSSSDFSRLEHLTTVGSNPTLEGTPRSGARR